MIGRRAGNGWVLRRAKFGIATKLEGLERA